MRNHRLKKKRIEKELEEQDKKRSGRTTWRKEKGVNGKGYQKNKRK